MSEDVLLEALADAWEAPESLPAQPSLAELTALRRAVRAHHDTAPRRAPWHRRSARGTAGLVLALSLAGAGTAAAATGSLPVPRPVRALAYDLGLPVTPPRVQDVHDAVADLRSAKQRRDNKAVIGSAVALKRALNNLDATESPHLQAEARQELASVGVESHLVSPGPTEAQPGTDPASTDPPSTDPPSTDPPATDPVSTDPPSTDPGSTDPPSTEPGSTDPPVTDPAPVDPSQASAPSP